MSVATYDKFLSYGRQVSQCDVTIKLSRKWDEDINCHTRNKDFEDTIDDDDIIGIDKRDEDDNSNFNVDLDFNKNIIDLVSNKRKTCSGLHSAKISAYIDHTSANFGSSRHIEVIAKKIWANRFKKGFSRKKLNYKEKRIFNCQIYAESDSIHTKEYNGYVDKNCHDKIYCTLTLANKAIKGVFNDKPTSGNFIV
ncbi:hypothetical protein C1646_763197 [Rhizophagus diaphanus]|nr:hypothetical protein C1646_763197 [Rhizophagus diaphanus] [Rhizophagus sp. MUCL 43196]